MMEWQSFHWLRPWALWLLLLLPVLVLLPGLARARAGQWRQVVDPRLLTWLLEDGKQPARRRGVRWAGLWLLSVLALAGPSWSWQEVPLLQNLQARVLVLDLSASMNATDVKPSRLERARFKLTDLIQGRREGQHGLVVFAGDAFVVTPLSDDWRTIQALLPSLSTDLMPVQGSRVDLGLEKALQVLRQAGVADGEVVLLTDSPADERALAAAADLRQAGHTLWVLAVGSETGAPVPAVQGGFLKDRQGQIVISRLDIDSLRRLAEAGGGRLLRLTGDDRDIRQLLADESLDAGQVETRQGRKSRIWEDRGWWLLPLIVLAFLPLFRRGLLFGLLLWPLIHSPTVQAVNWSDLWRRPDQQAWQALRQQQPERAVDLAQDPALLGEALFRAGRPHEAAEAWQQWIEQTRDVREKARAWYDRGNALAHAGQLEAAIDAYRQAEALDPELRDAGHNRKVLEDFLRQRQQQNQQQQQQDRNDRQQQEQNSQQNQTGSDQKQQDQQPQSRQHQDSQEQDARQNPQNEPSQGNDAQDTQQEEQQQEQQAQQEAQQRAEQRENEQRQQEKQEERQQPQPLQHENDPLTEEERQALEQWLRQVPDDPGGLLRRKFLYQYRQRQQKPQEEQPW